MEKPFPTINCFFVWQEGGPMPSRRHRDYTAALQECNRLSNLNKGKKFILLGAFGHSLVPEAPSTFTSYLIDDLPF
jgi:hypothetical protein